MDQEVLDLRTTFFEDINTFPTNLTILKFYSTFDNTQIGCGGGGDIPARFDLIWFSTK